MADPTGFQQIKLDAAGTYGAFNPATNQAIAFTDPGQFHSYFANFDPNASLAKFDTSALLANPNQLLTVDQIGATKALDLGSTIPNPGTPGATAANPDAMVAGVKSYSDYLAGVTPPKTDTQTKADTLTSEISTELPKLGGKQQALADAELAAGVPEMKKQLADMNALILSRTAGYEAAFQNAELQTAGATTYALTANQGAIRRNQASEIGLLQARALGLQGQVQSAMDTADRAIDLKYASIEDDIKIKQAQLALLAPALSADEKRQATALDRQYADQQLALNELKAKQKANMTAALQANVLTPAVNMGGEFFRIADGKPYTRPEEFFKDFGVTSFAEAYAKGLVTDLKGGADLTKLPTSYQEYALSTNNPTPEGYNAWLTMDANRKKSTTSITYNQGLDIVEKNDQASLATFLATKTGKAKGDPNGNEYVSPQDYTAARNAWVQDKHSAADFDNIFSNFVDPTHPQDYGVKWKVAPPSAFEQWLAQQEGVGIPN